MIRRLHALFRFPAVLAGIFLLSLPVAAQQAPAGYVVSVTLAGKDRTAITRSGDELVPKLMMPLYDGDVVFLRERESQLVVETGDGSRIKIAGGQKPYELKGEIPTADDARVLLSAVAETLSAGTEKLPAATQDEGALQLPMAVRGPNFLVKGERRLWLAWTGGTAPFKLIVEVDGRATVYDAIRERKFTVIIPAEAGKRFEIVIKDEEKRLSRTTFRIREFLPEIPATIAAAAPGDSTGLLILAVWLTTLHEGDWSVEAAQRLHARADTDQAAAALLDRIVQGWKLKH